VAGAAERGVKDGRRKRVVEEARRLQVEKQKLRRSEIRDLWTSLDAIVPGEGAPPPLIGLPVRRVGR